MKKIIGVAAGLIIGLAMVLFVTFSVRTIILSRMASNYYKQSQTHAYRSISASYSFNIEEANEEYDIAKDLNEKGDSVYYKIFHLKTNP